MFTIAFLMMFFACFPNSLREQQVLMHKQNVQYVWFLLDLLCGSLRCFCVRVLKVGKKPEFEKTVGNFLNNWLALSLNYSSTFCFKKLDQSVQRTYVMTFGLTITFSEIWSIQGTWSPVSYRRLIFFWSETIKVFSKTVIFCFLKCFRQKVRKSTHTFHGNLFPNPTPMFKC